MVDVQTVHRPTARALIVREEQILLLRKTAQAGQERYCLPGGGQDPGEGLQDALLRECREEIGCPVDIGPLVHVAEFLKETRSDPGRVKHVIDFLFHCHVPENYRPQNGPKPDRNQIDVCWMSLSGLPGLRLDPGYLGPLLTRIAQTPPVYLGLFDG